MLKHVVAHRSNSSLGGCTSPGSCSSSFASGPSSLSSFVASSSLPSSRRSSLSSAEVRNRPVYRRANSHQPFSLPLYREPAQILGGDGSSDRYERSQNVSPLVDKDERENEINTLGIGNGYVTSNIPYTILQYKRVYPERSDHIRNNYINGYHQRSTTVYGDVQKEHKISAVPQLDTQLESPPETQQSFVEKINLQDSHPSESNTYEVDDLSDAPDYRGLHLATTEQQRSLPLEGNHLISPSTESKGFPSEKQIPTQQNSPVNLPANNMMGKLSPMNIMGKFSLYSFSSARSQITPFNTKDSARSNSVSNVSNIDPAALKCSTDVENCKPSNETSGFTSASLSQSLYGDVKIPGSNSADLPPALPRSSTLPRRDELRRASFRSNVSTCSLMSSVSCSSLNHSKNLESRSTSTSSLSETIPVKIYLRRLRPDMEYKTVSLSSQTTCKELIASLLTKFRLRHRDPKLFFVVMEVTVRSPTDNAPVKRTLILDDNARPAELQQCRPKGEARFSIGVRRGGLVRVHDSILMPGSQYKSLMVSYTTTSDELVQLMLKCYNILENPKNYALHEVCKNPYSDRPLCSDECPLMVQYEWPRTNRSNWAFVLRRNLTYAFSLKSRMCWRRSLDQSSTDTESELDDHTTTTSSLLSTSSISSSNESRSSSLSSASSVSSSSSSSDNSLDSGYLGSPLSSCKTQTSSTLVNHNSKNSRELLSPNKARSILPVTASVSKLSLNSSLPSISGPPSSLSTPSGPPLPVSTSTPASDTGLPPKPKTKTIITITSTGRLAPAATGNMNNIQRRHLRPVIPPPSLKITPAYQSSPQNSMTPNKTEDSPHSINLQKPSDISSIPSYANVGAPYVHRPSVLPSTHYGRSWFNDASVTSTTSPHSSAEQKLLDAIESLKTLSDANLEEKYSASR